MKNYVILALAAFIVYHFYTMKKAATAAAAAAQPAPLTDVNATSGPAVSGHGSASAGVATGLQPVILVNQPPMPIQSSTGPATQATGYVIG